MELRVLKYFLMVAREENITRAAALLNITQPTLSRQMIQLEEELGVKLFDRNRHRILLTDDGMLLKRRAQEIVSLADRTEREFQRREDTLTGEISIGCGETRSMSILSAWITDFRKEYPLVQFQIYSATADDIKDRMEKGILDIGLMTEPVDIGKYEFIRLPVKEAWGVLVRKDSPLAGRRSVSPEDLLGTPLLTASRELVRNELKNWFGDLYDRLDIAATYNLVVNASELVRHGAGAAVCFRLGIAFEDLCFVPLAPELKTGSVLAWKKSQMVTPAVSRFLQFVKQAGIRQPEAWEKAPPRNNAEDPENQEEVQNGKNL